MKVPVALLVSTITAKGALKEWEVQNAYFTKKEIILSDPNRRSNKKWHDCGEAPPTPLNGQGVTCVGNTCFAVCPIGWRSQGRWKLKCKANNTWNHLKFSPCITCPDMSNDLEQTGQRGVQFQSIVEKRNYPITQFFCGDATNQLGIKGKWYKKGGNKKSVRCLCRNGQKGDPSWKKSCSWSFKDAPWTSSDINTIQCKPNIIDDQLVFSKWSEWESCSVTCGDGTRSRTRICMRGDCDNSNISSSNLTETETCSVDSCGQDQGDLDDEFCIRLTSSESSLCAHNVGDEVISIAGHWAGGTIHIDHNGKNVAKMPSGSQNFEVCLPLSDVDVENDEFSLHATSSNGVCITGLFVNKKQILVGKDNDLEAFWLDHDQPSCIDGYMSSSHMIIQNGEVVLSQCKPRTTNGWTETVQDCYMGNRDPSRCKGGYCAECGKEGYCCSGNNYSAHNHNAGKGPNHNDDQQPACPQDAVDVITSYHHVCVSKVETKP